MTAIRDGNRDDVPTGRRSGLPLPERVYIPQQNTRHPDGAFDPVRAQADPITRSENASRNIAWLHGLDLLESGFYWEAHEVLEAVWLNAPPNTPERTLVQGVIQLANAALKHRMKRRKAALRLCDIADALIAEAKPDHSSKLRGHVMDLSLETLSEAIDRVRASVRTDVAMKIRLS